MSKKLLLVAAIALAIYLLWPKKAEAHNANGVTHEPMYRFYVVNEIVGGHSYALGYVSVDGVELAIPFPIRSTSGVIVFFDAATLLPGTYPLSLLVETADAALSSGATVAVAGDRDARAIVNDS